jgi:hypothetical protein
MTSLKKGKAVAIYPFEICDLDRIFSIFLMNLPRSKRHSASVEKQAHDQTTQNIAAMSSFLDSQKRQDKKAVHR